MQTIQPLRTEEASRPVRRLLDSLNTEHGGLTNMLKTMAHSPGVLEVYLDFNREVENGLGSTLTEQIALTVAQADQADYALALHTARAKKLGLSDHDIASIREGRMADRKKAAALKFARNMALRNGEYSVGGLRAAGYTDADIVNIIACTALHLHANLFNEVAKTELDFPRVGAATKAA